MIVRRLGLLDYEPAVALQDELVLQRQREEIPDTALLLRHPPVITVGSRGDRQDVLDAGAVPVLPIRRGGEVTYHGPEQVVVWVIKRVDDLHQHLRWLEQLGIDLLQGYGLEGERVSGRTGVWVRGGKIAAIGVRASRWVTSHGMALNVGLDLSGFARIVPCGIRDAGVTSLGVELGQPPALEEVELRLERLLVS